MKKMTVQINKNSISRAVENSSRIEGMSLVRAKNNTFAIKLLKQHGRAFDWNEIKKYRKGNYSKEDPVKVAKKAWKSVD